MWALKPKPQTPTAERALFDRAIDAIIQGNVELQQARFDRQQLRAELKALEQSMLDRAQQLSDKMDAQAARLDALEGNITQKVSDAVSTGIANAEAAKDKEVNDSFDALDTKSMAIDTKLSAVEASLNTSTQSVQPDAPAAE